MSTDQSTKILIDGLVKGFITVNRVEEFKNLQAEYPDDPSIHRLFADFLKKKNSFINAIEKYRKAYNLFMVDGKSLSAIAAMYELWEITAPTPYDFRCLFSNLHRRNSHNSFVSELLAKMSYPELRAVISCLEKIKVKSDDIVKEADAPEDSLFFVVSGELQKSPVEKNDTEDGEELLLKANDYFGDYFPFQIERPAPYQVKAVCDCELLKISKENLMTIFRKYPDLKIGFNKILKYESIPDQDKPAKFYRKTSRRDLSISLSLDIVDREPGRYPLTVKGSTQDLSLDGARVIIDPRYRESPIDGFIGHKTKLRICLPDETINVSIMGEIVWCKDTESDGQPTSSIGVKFNEMPPGLRGSMIFFISALSALSHKAG